MIEVFNCEQGTPEWFQARSGIPTASCFSYVLAKGQGKTRRTYMLKLIGERITGEIQEGFSNSHTDRGHIMEPEARELYRFKTDNDFEQIGFIRNGDKGASPDSIISTDGLLEIKTKLPHLQAEVILSGKVPAEHIAQIQGAIWVSEREWCDFVSYWPNMPLFVKRVYRDDEYIKRLSDEIDLFSQEMADLEQKIRNYK